MDNNSAVTSRSSRRQYGDGQQYEDRRQNSRRQNENGRDTGQSIYDDDDDDDDDDYIGTSPRPHTQPPETPVTPMAQNNNRNHSTRRHVDSDRSQDLASRRSRAQNNDSAPKQMEITSEVLKETNDDNWQEGKSLKECNHYMLTYEVDCDVTFLVGEYKEAIKCHKYVLMSRNSKFYKILQKFRVQIDTLLTIPDIQADVFRHLIMYIYTDEIDLSIRLANSLLYPAYKFGVTSLLRKCFEFMMSEMSSDTVCKILESAHTFNEQSIYEKCLRFIYVNAIDVLKVPNFRDLCKDCVSEIVKADDLLTDETQVYDALVGWANGQCARNQRQLPVNDTTRREVLGDMLFYVRFPLMDVTVFTQRISKSNVLKSEEKIALFQYFHGEISNLPEKFNRRQRKQYSINKAIVARAQSPILDKNQQRENYRPPSNQSIKMVETNRGERIPAYDNIHVESDGPVLRVVRYKGIGGPWNLKGPDAISFRCSSTILFRGVQVFGPFKGTDYCTGTISLFDEFRNEVLTEEMNLFTNKAKVYDVMLRSAVRIPKQRLFTVVINMTGKPTIQGTDGIATVVTEDVRFEFINSNRSNNGTDVSTGQIPALLFSKP